MKLVSMTALLLMTARIAAAEPAQHGPGEAPPVALAQLLAGNTATGVIFLAHPEPAAGGGTAFRAGESVTFEAYLRPDGTARVRSWDPRRNAYTPVMTRHWRVEGNDFCLGIPLIGSVDSVCMTAHSWGPIFNGIATNIGAMIKGDVRTGNAFNL
jgi:hypothetical protein